MIAFLDRTLCPRHGDLAGHPYERLAHATRLSACLRILPGAEFEKPGAKGPDADLEKT